jgi:hypothetical protein
MNRNEIKQAIQDAILDAIIFGDNFAETVADRLDIGYDMIEISKETNDVYGGVVFFVTIEGVDDDACKCRTTYNVEMKLTMLRSGDDDR